MVSAELLSNKGKNKVTKKKTHGVVTFWIQLRRTYQDFSSQADSARENWIWSCRYLIKNEHFTSVQNKVTCVLSLFYKVWH